MIPATKLVYDFERKYNHTKRGESRQIPLVDVIAYLNEAQGIWYGQMADLYETTEFVASELREFEEKNVELDFISRNTFHSIFRLPPGMYKRLNQKAVASDSCCGDLRKTITVRIEKSDKINEVINDPFFAPDFAWEQLPANEAGDFLYLYHGTMNIHNVYVDFLRFPKEIHAPSLIDGRCSPQEYEDYAGKKITEDSNFEPTSRFSDRKVVDIAVMLAKGDRDDYNAFQKQMQQIIFGDNQLKQ